MGELLIVTGGTIDKHYDQRTGDLDVVPGSSCVDQILATGRDFNEGGIAVQHLIGKDSLEMTEEDRAFIAHTCIEAEQDRIVITHGTDTMVETAKVIKFGLQYRKVAHKTIVLTGAMIPYIVNDSDASYNLGVAFAYARALRPGTYVAMNGAAHDADGVYKDKERGVFLPLTSK
jgi:L-asparaginase